jgi:Concanavalin A-like lectin/glucanases superfamily
MLKLRQVYAALLLFAICSVSSRADQPERGLVLHYPMDEGSGGVLADASGHGQSGLIHNATWVKLPSGYALEFDGEKSYVDCGGGPQLDIRGPITVMAWICPAQIQAAPEPGIVGKQFGSYLLSYYRNRTAYWYIDEGGNNASASAPPATWSHVAGMFDETTLALYVNGELARSSLSKHGRINGGGNFYIGAVLAGAPASGSDRPLEAGFKGLIDEVKVYDRALEPAEIRAEFQRAGGQRNSMFAVAPPRIKPKVTLKHGALAVGADRNGAIQITSGKSSFALESEFTYPGLKIGSNALSAKPPNSEHSWQPRLTRLDERTLQIEAEGKFYSVKRTVRLRNERIEWEDTLRNRTDAPVSVMIGHHLVTPGNLAKTRVMTTADSPFVFFSLPHGDVGMVAEDDEGRLQFEASAAANHVLIRHSSFALDAGKSHTFRYAIYPFPPTGDVYAFINRVRRDWQANFTIEGPFAFFDAFDPRLETPGALARYLQRRKLKLVALSPWLDYDPGLVDHVLSGDEYKSRMQKVARAFHQIDPGIKVLGSIETDWVALFPDKVKNGSLLQKGTPEQITKLIDDSDSPWQDSLKRQRDGNVELEHYVRGGKPQLSLSVYPAAGNAQEKFLLGQERSLLEEVGLDGVYIDEFNQAWNRSVRSYSGWDGVSVEINPDSGEMARKYVNCGLAGIPSRLAIINYALSRGKTFVANTWATSAREQALPALRFWEMQDYVNAGGLKAGAKPPLVGEMLEGLFGSPIGLGITPVARKTKPGTRPTTGSPV